MMIVGLTGGIGSGKTAASDWFARQQITVVDADVVARDVVAKGSAGLESLVAALGSWILQPDGELDRAALREHIFRQPAAREQVEAITHPLIRLSIAQQLMQATSPYVILVAPLLLESGKAGLGQLCRRILVIDVPEDMQLARAMQRDHQDEQQIRRVMTAQLSREARLTAADDVVVNSGTLDELYVQLAKLHAQYLQLASTS